MVQLSQQRVMLSACALDSSMSGIPSGPYCAIDKTRSRHLVDTSGRATTVFVRQVHRALRNLYNPAELGKSPLAGGLATDRRHGSSAAALREALTEAIESLKPDIDVPPQANA